MKERTNISKKKKEPVMHEWILLHNGTIKLFLLHISLLVALYSSSVILSELSLHAALPLFLFFFLTLSCHEEKPGRLSLEMDKLTVFFLSPAACGALQLRALPQHVHSHDTEGRLGCFRSSHCGIKTVLISSSNTQHYERTRVF